MSSSLVAAAISNLVFKKSSLVAAGFKGTALVLMGFILDCTGTTTAGAADFTIGFTAALVLVGI